MHTTELRRLTANAARKSRFYFRRAKLLCLMPKLHANDLKMARRFWLVYRSGKEALTHRAL